MLKVELFLTLFIKKKKLICLVYAVHWKKKNKFLFDCVIVLDYDT